MDSDAHPRMNPYQAAFCKGYKARLAGAGLQDNEYGFPRYARVWQDGWRAAGEDLADGDRGGWTYERLQQHGRA